jgi:hypothetical protein
MKYRIAYAVSSAFAWLDETVFDHGERQPFVWLDIRINGEDAYFERENRLIRFFQKYRLCFWNEAIYEWATRQCCDGRFYPHWVGCTRCQTVWPDEEHDDDSD